MWARRSTSAPGLVPDPMHAMSALTACSLTASHYEFEAECDMRSKFSTFRQYTEYVVTASCLARHQPPICWEPLFRQRT